MKIGGSFMTNLIVSDYDGTIKIANESESLRKNVELLKMMSSYQNKVMISTGRLYKSMLQEILNNNIPFDYISCANGNLLFDEKLQVIYKTEVDAKIVKQLKPFYNKIIEIDSLDEFGMSTSKAPVEYLIHIVEDLKVRKQIVNKILASSEFDYCTDEKSKFSIHIFNQSDKIQTLKIVKELLKLSNEMIFTIGDGVNDMGMIIKYNGYLIGNNIQNLSEIDNVHRSESFENCIEEINHTLTLKKVKRL